MGTYWQSVENDIYQLREFRKKKWKSEKKNSEKSWYSKRSVSCEHFWLGICALKVNITCVASLWKKKSQIQIYFGQWTLKALVINCSVYAMLLSSMILRAKCFLNSFSFVFCVSSLIIIPMITARFILGWM